MSINNVNFSILRSILAKHLCVIIICKSLILVVRQCAIKQNDLFSPCVMYVEYQIKYLKKIIFVFRTIYLSNITFILYGICEKSRYNRSISRVVISQTSSRGFILLIPLKHTTTNI